MTAVLCQSGSAVLPWWLVVPVSALVMLAVAAHLIALQSAPIPASRRRIRTATGFLMLIGVPLFAYALSISHRHQPDRFVLVWLATVAIFGLIALLGCLDIANNVRLGSRARAEVFKESAARMAADISARRGGGSATSEPGPQEPPRGA